MKDLASISGKLRFKMLKAVIFISLLLLQHSVIAQNTLMQGWFAVIQEKPRFFLDDEGSVWGDELVFLGSDSSLILDCSTGDIASMDIEINNIITNFWDLCSTKEDKRLVKDLDSLFNKFIAHHSGATDSIRAYRHMYDYRLMKYPKIFKLRQRGYDDYGRRLHFFTGCIETIFLGKTIYSVFPEGEIGLNQYVYFGGNSNDSLNYKFSIVHPQNGRELFIDVGY